jgi:hypothetical protein
MECILRKNAFLSASGRSLSMSSICISPPFGEAWGNHAEKEPISGVRLGFTNDYTGRRYFRVFNSTRQPISPVTGRTVDTLSDLAHYPLDPFSSTVGGQ